MIPGGCLDGRQHANLSTQHIYLNTGIHSRKAQALMFYGK